MVFSTIIFVSGCKSDDDPAVAQGTDNYGKALDDVDIAETAFSDVLNMSLDAESDSKNWQEPCATLSIVPITPGVFPKTITIDWGNEGTCQSPDGKIRQGVLVITYTGRVWIHGSSMTVEFQGYKVDSIQVNGTYAANISIQNNVWSCTQTIVNGEVTTPSGTIDYDAVRTISWIAGMNTLLNSEDDEYSISGTAHGTTLNGDTYVTTITDDLLLKASCKEIVSGVIQYAIPAFLPAEIDFGNGACDNTATLSIPGTPFSQEITL